MSKRSVDTSDKRGTNEAREGAEARSARSTAGVPAGIKLIYESRDGGLCVFEDAHGHLTSVRASQLA